ncbi:MAG: glycosyltransferase family 2 protein, partial [bacterium]
GSAMDTRLLDSRFRRRERYASLGDSQESLCFTDGGAAFCCTLVPRNLIEQHGFLDERFPIFFNDGDFAFRLFQEGYKAYVLPHVHACHHGGASVTQLDATIDNKEFIYGLRTYSRKHRGRLYGLALDMLLGLNLLNDLQQSTQDVISRRKAPGTILEPVRRFRETLAYRPSNAE